MIIVHPLLKYSNFVDIITESTSCKVWQHVTAQLECNVKFCLHLQMFEDFYLH